MGLIPKRYLSFHSVGFVHPHTKHLIFSVISLSNVEGFKFLIDVHEVHFKSSLFEVFDDFMRLK